LDLAFVGVTVGHWTDSDARTGCTVVRFDRPALAAVEIRGGAPGSRETELLGPGRLVQRADAILLTGGSAFGLAAADGVVASLAAEGRGFPTPAGPVPIVPAAVLYDLAVGRPVSPTAEAGTAAIAAAGPILAMSRGAVGAGSGATTGKAGGSPPAPGGVGLGVVAWAGGAVAAIVAVNAFGDVVDPRTGRPAVAPAAEKPVDRRSDLLGFDPAPPAPAAGTSTTLAVVIVAGPADHATLGRCAVAAHDGFARAIRPCHTVFDGDAVFVATLAEGAVDAGTGFRLALGTELAVEQAIIDAVRAADQR
jgi:L-aminopeptidase/D-esterase-like protein